MGKSAKIQHSREKMRVAAYAARQTKLDKQTSILQKETAKAVKSEPRKQIIIAEIIAETKENELALKVAFQLLPSLTVFTKI